MPLQSAVKMKKKSILEQRTKAERVVYIIIFILFAIYALSLLYPMFYLFVNSFQDALGYQEILSIEGNPFSLPEKWHFKNYLTAFDNMYVPAVSTNRDIKLLEMFFNSFWIAAAGILGNLLSSAFSAYSISRYKFVGRNLIYGIAIFSMTVPVMGSMAANFKLMTDLKLYNTPFLPIVTAFGGFGFNFLLLYGFFKNISWSYAESVFIDGGGHFTVFFKIMLPQARTPIFTLAIMASIGAWNDYMGPLLYLPDFPTVASGLYRIQTSLERQGDYPIIFASLFLSAIPVVVVFSIFSDKIMTNFTIGGLKG